MEVSEVMKPRVVSIPQSATLEDAIEAFIENNVGLLPVVDESNRLTGVLGLQQVLSLSLPAFVDLLDDYDFVHDFGALEEVEIREDMRSQKVTDLMVEPISVGGHCKLMRAAAIMRQHDIRDLPVVDRENRLVGLASWVDVGAAFLRGWADGTKE